jgi:hypothetical protein
MHALEENIGVEGLHNAIEKHAVEHMGLSPSNDEDRRLEEKILAWWREKN